ncbi:MAG: DUF1573 domain-containing protein [Chloroflexota bacterium]|jgi:hypothetical protein
MKLLVLILLSLFLAACSPQSPAIEVAAAYDFGPVVKGKIATAELPVTNSGSAPLIIEAVSTSCGCTTATLSTMTIDPGQEAILSVAYDTAAHESDMGLMERTVFLATNDQANGDVMIRFTALVELPDQ